MQNIDFLRYLAVQAIMECTDESLLDLVDKLLITEGGAKV